MIDSNFKISQESTVDRHGRNKVVYVRYAHEIENSFTYDHGFGHFRSRMRLDKG